MKVTIKRMVAFILVLSMVTSGSYMDVWATESTVPEQTATAASTEAKEPIAEQPNDSTEAKEPSAEQPNDPAEAEEPSIEQPNDPVETEEPSAEQPNDSAASTETDPTEFTESTTTQPDESTPEEEQISAQSLEEEAEIVQQGKCGDNATYVLDSNGVLTISGTGAMWNYYSSSSYPWHSNRSMITQVVIQKSVSSIGNYAFYYCTNLSSVTIPDSVISIGSYAFYYCTSLNSVTIPDSVTSIGRYAFCNCSKLTEVHITDLSKWCGISFGDTYANPLYYAKNLILNDAQVIDLVIPDGITTIVSYAFRGCTSLNSVTIPDSVTSIGSYAFWNCTSLNSVTIPDSVTSIGNNAFYNCTSLSSVTIPDSVTSIGNNAFYKCTSLSSVTIPDSVTSIGSSAFSNCTSLSSVTIPDSVTSIGSYAFSKCTSLTEVHITDLSKWCGISFGDYSANPLVYAKNLILKDTQVTELVIPDGITFIGSYAFYNCTSLSSVKIPDSVTSIGSYAFYKCTSLSSVKIPDSVTSIGSYAFSNCPSLTEVHITDLSKWCGISFGDIYANPLYRAENLILNDTQVTELVIPDGTTSIGSYAFCNCTSLNSVTIPDSVTSIGNNAFYKCTSLSSVKIPDSVTFIGINAFYDCTKLKEVHITDLSKWCGISFGNYSANPLVYAKNLILKDTQVTELVIPDGITSIGSYAFYNCTSLGSVKIPNSVTSIGSYAFNNCTSLSSVTIPDSVTTIGSSAFSNCTSLTEVHITDLSKWCGIFFENASANPLFYAKNLILNDTQVTDLVIPDGITTIGNYAFRSCKSLSSVTIPDSVTSIGANAFSYCNSLKRIEFAGNAPAIDSNCFYGVTADAYYHPWKDWTPANRENYGGTLTWHEYGDNGKITSLEINTMPVNTAYLPGDSFDSRGLTLKAVYESGTEFIVYPEQMEISYDFSSYGTKNVSLVYDGKTVEFPVSVKASVTYIVDSSAYQSQHPYTNWLDKSYQYSAPGASEMTLTFDSQCYLENGCDYLTIYDKNNVQIGKYTGSNLSNLTVTVPGDYFKLYFHTDNSYEYWGFAISKLEVHKRSEIPDDLGTIWDLSEDGQLTISGKNAMEVVSSGIAPWYEEREKITSVVFDGDFKKFYGSSSEGMHSLFEGCNNLKTIRFTGQSVPVICQSAEDESSDSGSIRRFFSGFTGLTILVPYQSEEAYQMAWAGSLPNTAELQSFKKIIHSGTCGTNVNWKLDEAGLLTISGTGAMINYSSYSSLFYSYGNSIKAVAIEDGVTTIGSYAFYNCTGLTEVSIPNSVTTIGGYAFYNCTGLTEISIPNSVTYIQNSSFANCSNLTRVEFGTGLKNLYAYTNKSTNPFYACNALTELIFHSENAPYLNSGIASSSNSSYATAFFSTDTMAGLQTIYVPGASLNAYTSSWSDYLPETVKILPSDITEDMQVSIILTSAASRRISFRWDDLDMVDSYEVYRDGEKIATTSETSYTDLGLEAGSSHSYAVVAVQGEIRTTPKEVTFAAVMPAVTGISGGVDNWMNEKYNVLRATVPDQNNLEGAAGVFTVNGTTLESTAETSGSNVIYSAEWDISSKTVPAGSYTVNFTLTDADGAAAEKSEQMTVDYTVPAAISGVTAIGDTQKVTLSWNISAEANTIKYLVYRAVGDDGEYTLAAIISNRNTLSFTDYNVDDGQTYHYYVLGKNKLDVTGSAQKAMRVSAVAQSDTELPTISSLTPKNDTRVHGNVSIRATAADNAGVKWTELYYAVAGDHAASEINDWNSMNKQYASACTAVLDTTKLPDGNVYIKAVACDTSNNQSNPMYRTLVVDNTGPDKVHDFTIKKDEKTQKPLLTATSVTLTWSDLDDTITNNHDRVGFAVEQKMNDTFTEVKRVNTIGAEIEGLSPGMTYVFRVRGYDDLGNLGTPSNELTVTTLSDTTAPIVTEILPESATYGSSLPLEVTVEDNSDVDRVTIIYSTDGKKTWKEYGENITFDGTEAKVTASVKVDLRSFPEGKVCFGAIAYDAAGNASGAITGYTNPYVEYNIDHTPPAEPKDFNATARLGEIVLSWTQGSEADLKGYNIYRSTSEDDETFTKIAESLNTISYHDTSISADTTYWYKLSAVDHVGNESVITKAVSVTSQVDNEAPTIADYSPKSDYIGGSSVRFGVNARDNWQVGKVKIQYQVNDGEVKNGSDDTFSSASVTASATVSLADMKDGDTLKFFVTVTDVQGLTTERTYTYTIDKTAPTITGLSSKGNQGTSITLSWQTGGESDLDGYYIYRIGPNGSTSCIAKTTGGSYMDGNILPRTVYGYRVTAVDKYGNSSSAELANVRSAPVYAVLRCDAALSTDAEYIFDAGESTADAEIKTYSFDFGDGTVKTGTAKSVGHTYTTEGTYTVKLTVTDADGNTDTVERQVVVAKPTTIGKTTIRVVNADNNPLVGAKVYFDYDQGLDNCKITNNSGKAAFSAEAGRYVIGIYYNSEYLPVRKTISVLPKTESTVTVIMSEQEIVTGEFAVNRVPLEELVEKYKVDPTVAENRDFVEVNVNMVFGEQQVSMVVVSDGWENFNYNEVKQYFINDRILTPVYIPMIKPDNENMEAAAPNPGFVAVLDVPVNATYTKEFFDVKLYIMNNASEEFTMTNNQVNLSVQNADRDGEVSSTDPSTGLVLIESPATCSSKNVVFGDLKGQETQMLEWLFRGDVEGYYNLTADYSGLLKEFNEKISATFKTNNPIHVYGASALNLDVDIEGNTKGGTVDFTLGLRNVTPDDTVNMPTLDIAGNIIEASKCVPENSGELTFLETWQKGAEMTREYIKKADGTVVEVDGVNELKPGETYCKDYRIMIGSDMLTYARYLQAVIKEVGDEHSIKTNIYVDGVEAEHKFLNYYSDNNATCYADGTKTAKCENGCGATKTVIDTGSKDKVKHHFIGGVCVNEGCEKQLQITVAFLTRLGGANGTPKTYSYDTSAESITIETAEVADGYEYKGWTLNGTLYTNDSELQNEICAAFRKEYSVAGDTVTIRPQATYEKCPDKYTVTIIDGKMKDGSASGTFTLEEMIYVYADKAPEGKFFDYWECNGVKVSNASTYIFFMPSKNVTLKAVYADEEKEELGTVSIERVTAYADQKQLTFVHTYTVPLGSRKVTAGVLATCNESDKDLLELGKLPSRTGNYTKVKSVSVTNYRYTWSKGNVTADQVWYVRAYLTYTDPKGKMHTIYGERIRTTLNGGYTTDK